MLNSTKRIMLLIQTNCNPVAKDETLHR